MKEGTRVVTALGVALAAGIAIAASGNAQALHWADYLVPLGTMWVNAIRMTVIPLVVSLLIVAIVSTSDLQTIGKLGGRSVLVFLLMLIGAAIIAVPLAPAIFSLMPKGAPPVLPPGAAEAGAEVASAQPQTLGAWLVSLVPSNPIAAAANGAMVQVIVFTILLALAITRCPPSTRDPLIAFFRALGDAMLVLVRWVILLAPLGIVALVLPLAAHAGASIVGAIGFYIAVYSVLSIVFSLLLYPVVRVLRGIPAGRFARAAFPAQTIAFTSSSSVASLPALVTSAEALGLDRKESGFVLPLAVSTFKFAAPVSWAVGALFVAWFYHVPLHATELATIAFAAVFLAFAAPGVPRGAFIMLAPLFVAVHLPPEGIGLLIAVDAIPDTFATVLNVTGDLAACALATKRVD